MTSTEIPSSLESSFSQVEVHLRHGDEAVILKSASPTFTFARKMPTSSSVISARQQLSSLNNAKDNTTNSRNNNDRTRRGYFRPGIVALREIRHYQKTTRLLLNKTSFQKIVRDICLEFKPSGYRIQVAALEVLQVVCIILLKLRHK